MNSLKFDTKRYICPRQTIEQLLDSKCILCLLAFSKSMRMKNMLATNAAVGTMASVPMGMIFHPVNTTRLPRKLATRRDNSVLSSSFSGSGTAGRNFSAAVEDCFTHSPRTWNVIKIAPVDAR